MDKLYWTIRNFFECPSEEGQGLVEYALIIALIAIALIAALGFVTGGIQGVFERIRDALGGAGNGGGGEDPLSFIPRALGMV